MKKLAVILLIVVAGNFAQAQKSNLGVSLGLPISEAGDFYEYTSIIEYNLLWEISESIDIGGGIGFFHTSGPSLTRQTGPNSIASIDVDNIFFPLTFNARYHFAKRFTLGLDVGYAFSLNDFRNESVDGGFYFAPKLQYGINDKLSLMLGLRSINVNDPSIRNSFDNYDSGLEFINNITFGIEIKL